MGSVLNELIFTHLFRIMGLYHSIFWQLGRLTELKMRLTNFTRLHVYLSARNLSCINIKSFPLVSKLNSLICLFLCFLHQIASLNHKILVNWNIISSFRSSFLSTMHLWCSAQHCFIKSNLSWDNHVNK